VRLFPTGGVSLVGVFSFAAGQTRIILREERAIRLFNYTLVTTPMSSDSSILGKISFFPHAGWSKKKKRSV
jgi:hypothetical protein